MLQNKTMRTERVIQFGEGGFLRGFVDWILQIVNEKTDFDGSVVVVQPIAQGMCDLLTAQNGVYTHIMRGMQDGVPTVNTKIIDVISRCVKPYDDYAAYLQLADNPDFRFVVSNTTESGIVFDAGDTLTDTPPKSFPAKVTALLHRRFTLGLRGFIFLPCELIEKNGETLKKMVLQYADLWQLGDAFKQWVETENIFCNTLVDRIVTGYPRDEKIELGYEDKMINTSELFHLWVIEGPKNILTELPLDKTGLNIIVTDDLDRYRTRKVRILNGAHTAMIPYAMLEGIETVKDCMEDENMSAFVKRCVFDEIVPTLDLPEQELLGYANDVFERFHNPFIRHLCASISLNSISKFKVRCLPSILEYEKRKGVLPANLIFSFAKLIAFYKDGTPTDDPAVIAFIREKGLQEILANKNFWGEDLSRMYDAIAATGVIQV
ncbi:MAG: tagaturonate reductase [Clostridia bacterium]|nr:tagaturonate reductase [Clostridia bacterium]